MSTRPPAAGRGGFAFAAIAACAAIAVVGTIQVVFLRTPVEQTMGIVQKIFYFHVPAAYAMYLGAACCLVGSAAFLARPTDARDALGRAGAETAVVFGLAVLVSGPLWAAKAWGVYWTWDPRLTTTLLSLLVYVAYVVLRAFGGEGESEGKFAAALGVLGAANLPIIHYSVQKWSGQHPRVITRGGGGLAPDMRTALLLGFVAFTLLAVVLVWLRVRVHLASARLRAAEERATDAGLTEET